MIRYLILLHLCLGALYGLYRWRLHRLPYLRLNRLYLLLTPLLCMALPLLQLPVPRVIQDEFLAIGEEYWEPLQSEIHVIPGEKDTFWDIPKGLLWIYGLGMLVQCMRSGIVWYKAHRILCRSSCTRRGRIHVCWSLPFSGTFFSHIYLGQDYLTLAPEERRLLLQHEASHARLGHTWDMVWLTLFQIVAWCNPLARRLLHSARSIHEFQADQAVAPAPGDFPMYARLLLKLQQTSHTLPVAAFHSHPLTERIMMLKQALTPKPMRPNAYLLILPVLLMLLSITAFRVADVVEQVPLPAAIVTDSHLPELRPVTADISSGFGMRMHPTLKEKKMHQGVDFPVALGTSVKAAGSGVVKDIQHLPATYGELLIIDHENGYLSRYAHLSEIRYKTGDKVQQGDVVALSGNTGMSSVPHLHFEILFQGNFVDPEGILK